jgi:hypothetical protein
MRSTPWTQALSAITAYELRDRSGKVLAQTTTHEEAARTLTALVLTTPKQEEEVFLCSMSRDGQVILREDIYDIELALLDS